MVEREKAHAGVVGFAAQHAIELDGVADGFVDLQTELRAIQNQVRLAFGTLIGGVQRHRLFSHPRRVLEQAQFFHQLVPLQLVLPAERIGIGAPLDLAILVAEGRKTGARQAAGLIDETPQGGCEDLPPPLEVHRSFRQADPRLAAQFRVHRQQNPQVAVHGNGERIDLERRDPGGFVLLLRGECDSPLSRRSARARDLEGQGGGGFDAALTEIVGGGEPPTAECQHANPDPHGFGARNVAGLAVLGGDLPLADIEGAHVGVGDAAPRHRVERAQCQVFHRGNRAE